jgi:protease-4
LTRNSRLLVALAAAFGMACEGRPQSAAVTARPPRKGPAVAVIDLSGGAPEIEEGGLLGPAPGRRRSFDSLLEALNEASADKDTKAVVVRFGAAHLGMARAEELGAALARVRTKLPVYCHAHGYTNATLMVAAQGCTKTSVSPAGEVEAIGIAAQVVYMHKLLTDELHLDVNFLQVGKFKGAEEPLTRDGPSDEARVSLEGTLADLRGSWLKAISDAKKNPNLALEDGPYGPQAAKAAGLVDFVGYEDEMVEVAKKDTGGVREVVRFGPGAQDGEDGIGDVLRAIAGPGASAPVVVVRAVGQISMGGGGGLMGDGGGITHARLSRQLARIERDDDIKVVVLRIDSPGGSALASDLMWHQLMRVRAKKKLVVSIGEMAASGGYYLASSADFVFADATSIVGSIGVVGGKIAVGDALERVGVHAETFSADSKNPSARARAAYASPLIAWDEPTKLRVYESMKSVYDLFLARVAEGRKISVEKVAASAEGRIFSGREGKARGLVDELGGLEAAIAKARALAGLPGDAKVDVLTARSRVAELLGGGADDGAESRNPISASSVVGAEVASWAARGVPGLAAYAGSLHPLIEGEHAVCALPFALTVR